MRRSFLIMACLMTLAEPASAGPDRMPITTAPSLLMQEAWQMLNANQPEEAWRILASFQPAPGDISPYYHAAAQALARSGKPAAAMQHYRLAYIFAPTREARERIMLERAEAYLAAGFHHEAAVCFEVYLNSFPWTLQKERASLGLAEARYRIGDFSEARRLYGLAGQSSRARYGKANALHALGRYEEAHAIYLSQILRDKAFLERSEETRLAIGENFLQMNLINDARIYLATVESDGLRMRAALSLGLIALREGAAEDAIKVLEPAARAQDRGLRHRAGLVLADAYAKAGRHDDALAALERILRDLPPDGIMTEAAIRSAQAHRGRKNFAGAAAALRRLFASAPPSAAALDELEALTAAARDHGPEELLSVWKTAGVWLLEPSRSDLVLSVAGALRGAGNVFLTTTAWIQKHGSRSARREAGLLLAEFHAGLGDAETASRYLASAGERSDDAYSRVASRIHAARGDMKAAADAVLALREPREEDILLLLAAPADYRIADRAAFCAAALHSLPGTVRLYVRYADFLYETGRRSEALRYYRSAASAELGPDATTMEQRDWEWARYRVSTQEPGATGPAKTGRDAAARLAEAARKAYELRRKAEQVM